MLTHKRRSFANLRYRRVRERIEEVVLRQDKSSLDTLRIDILIRFERFIETAIGRSREASSRGDQLRLRWSFGGMISLRNDILGEGTERSRRPQLSTRALDSG